MKKCICITLLAILLAQFGVWVICEMVARSIADNVETYRMIEPSFTAIVLGHRHLLWLFSAIWVLITVVLWKSLSTKIEALLTFMAVAMLFGVLISITAALACVLPWLPFKM